MKERIFIQKAKDQVAIEDFVRSYFTGAKCGTIEVQYTPVVTRIIIHTLTPGMIVGQGGERIRAAIEEIKKCLNLENPQIDVQKITNPFLDPHIVSTNIARALESRVNFKRLGEYYISKVMGAGAIGVEIVFSGKIGSQRGRTERFSAGYIKKCGMPAEEDVKKGFSVANPRLGNIGVTVKIMIKRSHHLKVPSFQEEVKEKEEKAEKEEKEKKEVKEKTKTKKKTLKADKKQKEGKKEKEEVKKKTLKTGKELKDKNKENQSLTSGEKKEGEK